MKNIRNFFILIAAATSASLNTAAAQEGQSVKFFVQPDKIEVKQGMAEVQLWYTTDITTLNTFQFDLSLPEGFSVEKNSRGNYKFTWNPDEDVVYDHAMTIVYKDNVDEPYYRWVGYSGSNSYLGTGTNMLLKFNIVVPDDFTFTSHPKGETCRIFKFLMVENDLADKDNPIKHPQEDINFTIWPSDTPTAIETITANEDGDEEEMIFDLHGVRVYRPLLPGFYIINGEKQFVK